MNVRKSAPLVISLVCGFSCISCVRDVILDAGEKPQVVVECVISNDSIQKLYLNFTKGASKKEAEPLTDAVATLIDLTAKDTIGEFDKKEGDLWMLNHEPIAGHHYRLEVKVPSYDLIWAEETMPLRAEILSYTTHFKQFDERDNNLDSLHPDPYAYYFNGTYYMFGYDLSRPIWVYGIDVDSLEDRPDGYNLFEAVGPIAGEIYTDIRTVDNFNVKNKIYIPEVVERPNYDGENEIIGVDVMNYPDLTGSLVHDRFLRISACRAHEPFLITCNFKQWWQKRYPQLRSFGDRPMIFMSVSDAYDAYLKTALIMEEMQNSSDMSTIYLRDNLPSNIHGGIGVFGCKYKQTLTCFVMQTFIPIEDYPEYNIGEDHKFTFDSE